MQMMQTMREGITMAGSAAKAAKDAGVSLNADNGEAGANLEQMLEAANAGQ